MSSLLTILTLIALGAVVGGWLARRFPLDKVRTLCALVATAVFIKMAATNPNTTKAWLALALAVVLGSDLLISLVRRWQTPPTA